MSEILQRAHDAVSTSRREAHSSDTALTPFRVTLRALLLASVLIPPLCLWTAWLEEVDNGGKVWGPYPTCAPLLFTAVISLLCLIGINRVVVRLRGRPWLSSFELITVYSMVSIGTIFAGTDWLPELVARFGYLTWFGAQDRAGVATLSQYMPPFGLVTNYESLHAFYTGGSSLYTGGHLRAWLPAICIWLGYIITLLFIMLCLNSIIQRQWTQHERLTFPITQLPLAMVTQQASLFRSTPFWFGFIPACGIGLWNGLSRIAPSLPYIPTTLQYLPAPVNAPWNAIGTIHTSAYPWVIGLGFMLPPDLLFSVWFFYFFWKGEYVVTSALGLSRAGAGTRYPYLAEQSAGAYIALIGFAVWTGRRHLASAVCRAFSRGSAESERTEALPARLAVPGVCIGFCALVIFANALGLSIGSAIIFFICYFFIAVAITRVRAELGPPVQDFPGLMTLIVGVAGPAAFTPGELTTLGYLSWNTRMFRAHPMPQQLETIRMTERSDGSLRQMSAALMLAGVLGAASSFWALLHLAYRYGAGARMQLWLGEVGHWAFDQITNDWMSNPQGFDSRATLGIGAGLALAVFSLLMRTRFLWWPFHPIGYAMAGCYATNWFWLPLLFSWIVKSLVLRYGGLRAYRLWLAPCAYGLILGDFLPGSLWGLYAYVTDVKLYSFFP